MKRHRKSIIQEKPIFTIKNALRACGHREDSSSTYEYRAEEYALRSHCTSCNQAQYKARQEREAAKREVAIKWIKDHGIKLEAHIDASDSYVNAVQVTFYIPIKEK